VNFDAIRTPFARFGTDEGAGGTGKWEGAAASEVATLNRALSTLSEACAEAVGKVVQHFHGEDSWTIGPMPGCASLSDSVESQAHALLSHSDLNSAQVNEVTNTLKATSDFRVAARGARQALQLALLLQHEADGADAIQFVSVVSVASLAVAQETAEAVKSRHPHIAKNAALLFRDVDKSRLQAETELRQRDSELRFSPTTLRMIRAAVWNMAVSGEAMARVAARLVTTSS